MKLNKKIILILVITIILYLIFGYKTVEYDGGYAPGKTYYVRQSRITGISFCKVAHHCSTVDCKNKRKNSYSYEIHLKKYFEDENMMQIR